MYVKREWSAGPAGPFFHSPASRPLETDPPTRRPIIILQLYALNTPVARAPPDARLLYDGVCGRRSAHDGVGVGEGYERERCVL